MTDVTQAEVSKDETIVDEAEPEIVAEAVEESVETEKADEVPRWALELKGMMEKILNQQEQIIGKMEATKADPEPEPEAEAEVEPVVEEKQDPEPVEEVVADEVEPVTETVEETKSQETIDLEGELAKERAMREKAEAELAKMSPVQKRSPAPPKKAVSEKPSLADIYKMSWKEVELRANQGV